MQLRNQFYVSHLVGKEERLNSTNINGFGFLFILKFIIYIYIYSSKTNNSDGQISIYKI